MSQPKSAAPYSETLFAVLITFLTPLFLGGPFGNTDLAMARAAAIEMVCSFRIRSAWDLFTVCQIVAHSVGAFGSICLSMADDAPVNTVLRCRANAASLQRAADRAQDRLDRRHAQLPPDVPDVEPPDEAAVLETFRHVADAHRAVAQARAGLTGAATDAAFAQALDQACGTPESSGAAAPGDRLLDATLPTEILTDLAPDAPELAAPAETTPAATPAHPAAAQPQAAQHQAAQHQAVAASAPLMTDLHHNIVWAEAMATVAAELSQEMQHLPPAEQQKHRIRIAALSTTAQDLTQGIRLDPWSALGVPPAGGPVPSKRRPPR